MEIIDARGLDCPKPVLKAKEALDGGAAEIRIRVDNEVAASNVTRFLDGQDFSVKRQGTVPDITVEGRKNADAATQAADTAGNGSWSLLLLSDKIGADSDGLGDALMKAFLGTAAKSDNAPRVIALMNEGIKMALPDRSTCDTLRELEEKGVQLLICGTCAKHFGITEEIKIGVISNMFEITSAVFDTAKPIVMG